jgi:hypothetical protein
MLNTEHFGGLEGAFEYSPYYRGEKHTTVIIQVNTDAPVEVWTWPETQSNPTMVDVDRAPAVSEYLCLYGRRSCVQVAHVIELHGSGCIWVCTN